MVGWFVLITLETESVGDATAVSITGNEIEESLAWDDGEWSLLKIYATETEANVEFPNNAIYTITLSGGSLGTLNQQVPLGAPNYPSVPYLTKQDASRIRSINTGAPFTFHSTTPGATTILVSAEINEKISDLDVWDQETTPEVTSGTVPTGMLNAGHCYQLNFAHINETTINGTDGFGSMGFTLQTRVLLHDVFTVFSPHVSSIVGAWQSGDGQADDSVILVFLANGTYFHAEDGSGDSEAPDGIERGSYSWDENTGILTITPDVYTNGEFGASHPVGDFILSVSGDTLTVGDQAETSVLQRVSSSSNPLVGGWRICNNTSATPGVLVFLENNLYFHAEVNDGDPSGADGMERGTYTWDALTSALTTTRAVDTNGELSLSHPDPAFQVQPLGTRSMILSDKEDTNLSRISNAAVLP